MPYPLPIPLLHSLTQVPHYNEAQLIQCHNQPQGVHSVRIHNNKLLHAGHLPVSSSVPWATHAYYLSHRPKYTLDPLLHAGAYYVQEASSMLLEQFVTQLAPLTQPLIILDLCAAPGGKSTHLLQLINEHSVLISNELISNRNSILQENIIKWGKPNVVITQNDASTFALLPNLVDVIIVDAPCSGSGLFKKDNNAITEWSTDAVTLCAQRQQRILADVLPTLKEGGLLIYSTCSYSVQENEDIMDYLTEQLHMTNCTIQLSNDYNVTTTLSKQKATGYRCWPYQVQGEGFFISAFKKTHATHINSIHTKKINTIPTISKHDLSIVYPYIRDSKLYEYILQGTDVLAVTQATYAILPLLKLKLYIKQAGITMGQLAQGQLIPHHALAVSTVYTHIITKVHVPLQEALAYLSKANIQLQDVPKGWLMVCYNSIPLGLIKNLGNRINNYYPKNWRILMLNP